MKIQKLFIGGWFQRTTLHLSEVYDFFRDGVSPLELDPKKLKTLRAALSLKDVRLAVGPFDAIRAITKDGLELRMYEDGLIVLTANPKRVVADDIKRLQAYYEQKISPALGYLFSLGAPVPKELANIKTIYPYFVVVDRAGANDIKKLLNQFGQKTYLRTQAGQLEIFRGDKFYIIHRGRESMATIERYVEEQIFLREFKTQLHRYLNLHRIIWERIAEVKERGSMRGWEIGKFKDQVEGYAKTVNLIAARIEQMDTYITTRQAIFRTAPATKPLVNHLDFKYETLADTLEYVKDLWLMTKQYVDSTLALFTALAAKSTDQSVQNLTVVTSMGVGATLIGLFNQKLPQFSQAGVVYFALLVVIGFISRSIMKRLAQARTYKIRDVKADRDIR